MAPMADKLTDPRSLDIVTNPAEPPAPAPAPTGAEALQRAMDKERDQALVMVRQTRARLETIAADADLPPELRSMLDRAQSDLAAAEARCLGQSASFMSITDLAATVGAVERLANSINRDLAAARDRANSPEARQQRVQTSLGAMHHDLFEKKILDPYLRFESEQEEEEYRKRERARKEEIERLQKIGTPEAMKQANALIGEQLKDAERHGAGAAPEMEELWNRHRMTDLAVDELSLSPTRPAAEKSAQVAKSLADAGVYGPVSADEPVDQQLPTMAELQAKLGRLS